MAFNKFQQPVVGRRAFVGGALATSALAALAACTGGSKQAGSAAGSAAADVKLTDNTMSYYLSEPAFIDPYNGQENQGIAVIFACFDGLLAWDYKTGEPVALAAEDLPTVSPDGLTYTFKLRSGMKFHNGDPVDAASFKRGWQRMVDPGMDTPGEVGYHLAPVAGYEDYLKGSAKEISGLKAVDDLTFEVTLSSPMADFLAVCCHPSLVPVPQDAIDNPKDFLEQPIGNGAFKMTEPWKHNQYINTVAFDDYYGDKPKIDGVYFSIQAKPETAFNEFKAGTIDFAMIPAGQIKDTIAQYGESDDGYTVTPQKQVLTGVELSTYYLIANPADPYLKDVDVRHAIALAINRKNIVDTLYEGTRKPATSIMPTAIDDDPACAWKYCTYDPDQAKQILDKNYPANADGKREVTVTLNYNGDGGHEDIMSAIQADLEKVGIQVKQETVEWAKLLTDYTAGNYCLGRLGWTADYPIMDNFLYPNFFSTADNNYEKYNNPEVDQAILDARGTLDENERKAKYRQICGRIGEDMPVIPIMFYAHNYVGSERLKSFYYDSTTIPHFDEAEMA